MTSLCWNDKKLGDGMQGRIQDFGQGGPWAQNLYKIGVFPSQLPENCMIFKKTLEAREARSPRPPLDPPVASPRRERPCANRLANVGKFQGDLACRSTGTGTMSQSSKTNGIVFHRTEGKHQPVKRPWRLTKLEALMTVLRDTQVAQTWKSF